MSAILQESGVRIERKSTDLLPAGTKLRLLRDRILVKPLDFQPSKILQTIHHTKPLRGMVVAMGPGYRQKKWQYNSSGERTRMGETGRVIPMEVNLGDIVELGTGYDFPQILIGIEPHILCQEQDVCGVVLPQDQADADASAS